MLNAFVVPKPVVAEVCTPNPVLITGFVTPKPLPIFGAFEVFGTFAVFGTFGTFVLFVFNGAVPNTLDAFVWFGATLNGVVYAPNVPELNVIVFGVFSVFSVFDAGV